METVTRYFVHQFGRKFHTVKLVMPTFYLTLHKLVYFQS